MSGAKIICGVDVGQGEHSLCGFSFDAYSSGDSDRPIFFAKIGEEVTCPECRRVIREMRKYKLDFISPFNGPEADNG